MSASLYLDVAGPPQAPLVVLQHGFAGSARNWRPQLRTLRDRWRVVAFDARGHARSAARFHATRFTLDDFVTDFIDVAGQVGGPGARFVAGGLSLGAAVALHVALRSPERVRALVLAAIAPGGGAEHALSRVALAFADTIEHEGLEAAGERFVWGADSGLDAQAAQLVRQGFLEHPPPALAAILRQTIARLPAVEELAPALARLDVPTLVVAGSEDVASLEASRFVARTLPRAQWVEIPGAGHVVNLAAREAFDAALLGFLETLDAHDASQAG